MVQWATASGGSVSHGETFEEVPMAKGQVNKSKTNKPKLTPKEKAAKKQAKKSAKGK
jgi:hypothetical protein